MSTFDDVKTFVERGRVAYRNRAIGCYVAAAAVLGITAAMEGSDFYRQGPMVLVGMLMLPAIGFHVWYARLGWGRHPVMRALRDRPLDIVRASVETPLGSAKLLEDRQVTIATRDAEAMLTLHVRDLPGLGRALADHCPHAKLAGFPE